VDADTFEFFFLEMNTRVQVEHPVTEMVTGWDIVRNQLRLGRGTLPPTGQHGISARGASIECRLYAENPLKNFLPSPGILEVFEVPRDMAHCRIDTGVRQGDTITPYYDPMIAKLVTWGADREAARERMLELLGAVTVGGVRSNLEFLRAALANASFAAGRVDTGFIDRERPALLAAANH
jgi:acetyl/propionyl-CoA carboxylase alpha subunit